MATALTRKDFVTDQEVRWCPGCGDYAILAAEKAQRRWAHTEALAFFEDALKRLSTMPDTEPNRFRRIDAVVKQAEIKFALGRHAEHVAALEKIRDLVDASADPPRQLLVAGGAGWP